MTFHFSRNFSAAAACALFAGPALADLTAQDVWSDWRDYLTGSGYEVSAAEQMSGNTLSVSGLSMKMAIPDAGGELTLDFGDVSFTENGDGTVSVVMPASMPITMAGSDPESGDFSVGVTVTQTGHTMTASGAPGDMAYAYSAADLTVTLSSLMADGQDQSDAATFEARMSNVSSTSAMKIDGTRNYDQKLTSSGLTYNFAFDDPKSEDSGAMNGSLSELGFTGKVSMPAKMDPSDFAAMLRAGFTADGTFTYTAGQAQMSGKNGGEEFQFASTSKGGSLGATMNAEALGYRANQKGTDLNVSGSEIPFPIAIQMAETGFNLLMPISKSDEEQTFEFGILLGDFEMADMLWGIFDPGGVLPRDPATIALDLAGKAKVLVDVMNPDVMAEVESAQTPPGELNALTIRNLLVSAVGASLSGTGDFTFDNTDLQTFNGFPRPIGAVDLKLVGANGLIDKLIQMGIVSDQDAMGARMMMGMLAVPGEGEDTLTSRIEMNQEGHVLANGQRIQ